ncbi:RimK family alpha-L-glutamate ligase [Candidatus Falkowbacteria bacterium]|nr:RimK family alpha-L-glutamate ligase [Candidatus Falkowbacteria bacterium]
MNISVLTFSNQQKLSPVTDMDLTLLREAAEKRGHNFNIIYASDCQIKLARKPSLTIKNFDFKSIDVLITRANFLTANVDFNGSLIRQFELVGVPIVNKSLGVMRAKNKLKTLQILSHKNIPIPKTYMVSQSQNIEDIIADIGPFPVIIKSMAGSHGSGVSIVESKRGLRSIIDMIVRSDAAEPVMVQEYVKESKGKDVRVFIVGKRIVGAMERIASKRGEFRSNFHLGGRVRVATMSRKEKDVAFAAIDACGLDIAGVDLIRTKTGPKVLEVNANPGLEGITKATGRDIAGEIIQYAVRKAARRKNKI